jgi:serine phosphatase RsbU (regulator of sigma subunit)
MIINELRRLFNIEGVIIMLVNKERTSYTYYKVSFPAYLKDIQEMISEASFPLTEEGGGRIANVILERKHYYFPVADYSKIKNKVNREAAEGMNIKSNLIMPVVIKDEAIGAIMMSSHTRNMELSSEDIGFIRFFIDNIAAAINNSLLYEELKAERLGLEEKVKDRTKDLEETINKLKVTQEALQERNSEIESDLSYARQIQLGIIPEKAPDFKGYQIYTSYKSLDKLGGDLFDFLDIDENLMGILLCDVSGHGVPAAFITTMIKLGTPYNRVIRRNPGVFLEALRENVMPHMHGMFFTGVYCVINNKNHTLSFSTAGHLPILLVREGKITEFKPYGTIIGFDPESTFVTEKCELLKGDRVIIFTDGIIEAMKSDVKEYDDFYGKKRLYEYIEKNYKLDRENFTHSLYEDIFSFSKRDSFSDDVALIIIDRV